MTKDKFVSGEYFIYVKGDRFEIGRVKRKISDDKYACYYHLGETAAVTNSCDMHKIENSYVIKSTRLGGEESSKIFGEFN